MLRKLVLGLLLCTVAGGYWWGYLAAGSGAVQQPPPSVAPVARQVLKPSGMGASLTPAAPLADTDSDAVRPIFAAFAMGDFVGALNLADSAKDLLSQRPAFAAWLGLQMPVLLASAGWARLKVGDCDQARAYFERGNALKPTLEATKGLAVCHYKQKNMSVARDYFLAYLAAVPNDAEMQLLYTDVLESEARFAEAVGILRQLVHAAVPADQAHLAQRLASMEGRAQEGTLEQAEASAHFRLTFRAAEQGDLTPLVLTTLEDALVEFAEQFGLPPPLLPIEVVLYPRDAFKSVVTNGPAWAEGLFDGRLRIPVSSAALDEGASSELQTVLRHELVHALLALMSDSRSLPPWFDEGLAQRLACNQRPCAGFDFGGQPGGFLPEASFMTSYLSLTAVNAGRAYHQSLFLIMCIEAKYGASSLRQILSHLAPGSSIDSDALLATVNGHFATIYSSAKAHWQRAQLPAPSL